MPSFCAEIHSERSHCRVVTYVTYAMIEQEDSDGLQAPVETTAARQLPLQADAVPQHPEGWMTHRMWVAGLRAHHVDLSRKASTVKKSIRILTATSIAGKSVVTEHRACLVGHLDV